jgi:hypothetical protein
MSNQYTTEDFATLLAEAESLRRQITGLKRAVVAAHAAVTAAEHLGDSERGPLIAEHLRANVSDDGRVTISVVDAHGHVRTQFDTTAMRSVEITPAELASELKKRWPQLAAISNTVEEMPRMQTVPRKGGRRRGARPSPS